MSLLVLKPAQLLDFFRTCLVKTWLALVDVVHNVVISHDFDVDLPGVGSIPVAVLSSLLQCILAELVFVVSDKIVAALDRLVEVCAP